MNAFPVDLEVEECSELWDALRRGPVGSIHRRRALFAVAHCYPGNNEVSGAYVSFFY